MKDETWRSLRHEIVPVIDATYVIAQHTRIDKPGGIKQEDWLTFWRTGDLGNTIGWPMGRDGITLCGHDITIVWGVQVVRGRHVNASDWYDFWQSLYDVGANSFKASTKVKYISEQKRWE